ncbi:hypothetical protein, partial [Alteromonas antoniana]|uniref:hypothetical protein n=1 Tax=Alteromonas antoniana TaxID=2803813 RepID=UPI001C47CC55
NTANTAESTKAPGEQPDNDTSVTEDTKPAGTQASYAESLSPEEEKKRRIAAAVAKAKAKAKKAAQAQNNNENNEQ